jgi:hypothetical protein
MWMPAKLLSAKQSATEPEESEQEGVVHCAASFVPSGKRWLPRKVARA